MLNLGVTHTEHGPTGWSTRELAEMAGTTVKTIRHYHQAGLLSEPDRRENGYKAYGPEHLGQLLQILRMRESGFSVAQIGETMRPENPSALGTEEQIAQVDRSIDRLQAIRADLVASLDSQEHWSLPPGFSGAADQLSEADRAMSPLMARHFTQEAMAALRSMSGAASPIDAEFEQLPADASEEEIIDLSARIAPHIRQAQAEHPMPERVVSGDRSAEGRAARAIGRMLSELYNQAQVDVITRALDQNEASRRHSE